MNAHAANSELRGHLVEEADIQWLLCVESHIKVNLASSALAPRSTNLLSVWWGSWTSSPFQHRGTNLQDLSHFFLFPVTWSPSKGHRGHRYLCTKRAITRLFWSVVSLSPASCFFFHVKQDFHIAEYNNLTIIAITNATTLITTFSTNSQKEDRIRDKSSCVVC